MPNGLPLMHCEHEITPTVSTTTLEINATVFEEGGVAPTEIIRTDQGWRVEVNWAITGHLIRHLCGEWVVAVSLESIGPGPEYQFDDPPGRIPMDPCGDGSYSYTINVPAGAVDARDPDGTLYLVTVTLGSLDPCNKPGHIYAHCSGAHLHFVPGPSHAP